MTPSVAMSSWSRPRSAAVGSASGERPAIASKCEAVALEVAERLVAHDGRAALAGGQAVGVRPGRAPRARCAASAALSAYVRRAVGVDLGQLGRRPRRRGRPSAAGRARSAGRRRRGRGPPPRPRARRAPPRSRLARAACARRRAAGRPRRRRRAPARRCSRRRRRRRAGSRRSRTTRSASSSAAVWAMVEVEVVRLLARLGEVVDAPVVARHPLGHPRQRVERRDGRGDHSRRLRRPAGRTRRGGRRRRGRRRGRASRVTDDMRTILTAVENRCQTAWPDRVGPCSSSPASVRPPPTPPRRTSCARACCSALGILAAKPGYVGGEVGRNVDDPDAVGAVPPAGRTSAPTAARWGRTRPRCTSSR